MNKQGEEQKSANKPVSSKKANVILKDTGVVVVTGTPAL
jgi:hypothetical protein